MVWVGELTARAGAYIYSDDDIGVGEADIIPTHTRASAETTIIHGGRRVKAHLRGATTTTLSAPYRWKESHIYIRWQAAM